MAFVVKANSKNRNVNDEIMTPEHIAKYFINQLPLKNCDTVLDPFRGTGNFYNNFPDYVYKDWCEINENKDFFDYNEYVDWIISNPPYSKYNDVMLQSYKIAKNICYLIPLNKIVSSMGRIRDLEKFGGIRKVWITPAGKCNFPFGFPAAFVWIQKDYKSKYVEYEIIEDFK